MITNSKAKTIVGIQKDKEIKGHHYRKITHHNRREQEKKRTNELQNTPETNQQNKQVHTY